MTPDQNKNPVDNSLDPVDEHVSAFDTANLGPSILILLARIYDVQMLNLRAADRQAYDRILKEHSRGRILAPPPSLQVTDDYSE